MRLWRVDLDAYAETVAPAGLSREEEAHAARMMPQQDGPRWRAARHALRRIIAEIVNVPPESLVIEPDDLGKPRLHGGGLQFNLSHSAGEALIGVSPDRAIGLDIADRPYFRKVRHGDSWAVSDVLKDRTTGKPAFFVARRIDDRTQHQVEALYEEVRITQKEVAKIQDHVGLPRTFPVAASRHWSSRRSWVGGTSSSSECARAASRCWRQRSVMPRQWP